MIGSKTAFSNFRRDQRAATAIEYGLIAALIAVAGVTAFGMLGDQIGNTMNNATNAMQTPAAPAAGGGNG